MTFLVEKWMSPERQFSAGEPWNTSERQFWCQMVGNQIPFKVKILYNVG